MGTTGFWSYFSSVVNTIPLKNLENKIIFVDIVLYIYKYAIGIRKSGRDIILQNGKNNTHLHAIYKIIKQLLDLEILPVCVFDGKAPDIKEETIDKRKEITENSLDKCKKLKDQNVEETNDEYIKYFKRSFVLTREMIKECKEFLDIIGIPYVESLGEADPQCAALSYYYKNYSIGTLSEDSDIILNGGSILLRDLNIKDKTISMIEEKSIMDLLQEKTDKLTDEYGLEKKTVTHEVLFNFCHILGNDYCNGIRCSGGTNRDELFNMFIMCNFDMYTFVNKIFQLNKESDKILYYISEDFLLKWLLSKKNFEDTCIIHPEQINIFPKILNKQKLNIFLKKNEFRNDMIIRLINSVEKIYFNHSYNSYIYKNIINNDNYKTLVNTDDEWHVVINKKKKMILCN